MSNQLLGRDQVALDAKHRLSLPTRHREAVAALCANKLVLTEHPDGFLVLMPEPKWQVFSAQFVGAPMSSQWLKRIVLGSAIFCELDAASRLVLPPELRESAGIDKQVYLLGVGDHFELWKPEEYQARVAKQKLAQARGREQDEASALQAAKSEVRW